MTKLLKLSSLVFLAATAPLAAKDRNTSFKNNLQVKNDASIGGTLTARNVCVQCCNDRCSNPLPAVVSCNRCVYDVRGSVITSNNILNLPSNLNETFQRPLNVEVISGCGFSAAGQLTVFANNAASWNAVGLFPNFATTVSFTFAVTLDKPHVLTNFPSIAGGLKAGTNGNLVFQFPSGTATIVTITNAVNTKTDSSFNISVVANVFGSTQQAILDLINLVANNTIGELTGVDFVAQTTLNCPDQN